MQDGYFQEVVFTHYTNHTDGSLGDTDCLVLEKGRVPVQQPYSLNATRHSHSPSDFFGYSHAAARTKYSGGGDVSCRNWRKQVAHQVRGA